MEKKFRAWDGKKMHQPIAIDNEGRGILPGYQWWSTNNTLLHAPVTQFTGLKDFYDGDIVEIFDGGYSQGTYRIVWDKMGLKWILVDNELKKDKYYMDLGEFSWCPDDIKKIGTIYENKDLLE